MDYKCCENGIYEPNNFDNVEDYAKTRLAEERSYLRRVLWADNNLLTKSTDDEIYDACYRFISASDFIAQLEEARKNINLPDEDECEKCQKNKGCECEKKSPTTNIKIEKNSNGLTVKSSVVSVRTIDGDDEEGELDLTDKQQAHLIKMFEQNATREDFEKYLNKITGKNGTVIKIKKYMKNQRLEDDDIRKIVSRLFDSLHED